MRLYVAGKTGDPRVPAVQDRLDREGHDVFDWAALEDDKRTPAMIAQAELREVAAVDALVLIWHPDLLGGLVEVGAALASDVPVVLLNTWRQVDGGEWLDDLRESVFWALPSVYHAADVNVLVRVLRGLWARTSEPPSGRARELPV